MTTAEANGAQAKIQQQITDPTASQQVIDRAIKQHEEQGHKESGDGHKNSLSLRLCEAPFKEAQARAGHLRFQMLGEEVNNRVIAGDAVFIFEHVMAFVFEDQQVDFLTLVLQLSH